VRAELGVVGLTAGLWAAGTAILYGAGIVTRAWRSVLVWSGLAYLVGAAAVGLVLTTTTVAGVRLSTPLAAVAIAGVAALGLAAARVVRADPLAPRQDARDRRLRIPAAIVAALFLVAGTGLAVVQPIGEHTDGWAIWGIKSLLLYDHGTIPPVFATGDYGLSHIDYPLFWPVLEATYYRAMGGPETKLATLPFWLLYVAFAGTVAAVGARLTRPAIWMPLALGVLTTSTILDQLFWHYADVPTGILVGSGALLGGLWLAGHGTRWLVVSAVLLGAAANGKNEGLMAAVAVVAALLVAAAVQRAGRRGALLRVAAAGAFVAATVLPWRLWLAAHDVHGDIKASRAMDPDALADASGRVGPAADAMWDRFTNPRTWGYLAFVALLLIAVALARRATRRLGAYYGVLGGLIFLFLLLAYWVAETDLNWHLNTSSDRVIQLLGFAAIAAAVHLSAALYEDDT
jgi:hypothetical protein